jgi:hypothetical protein
MTRDAFTTGYISAMAWLAINENGSDDGLTVDDLPDTIVEELTADAHAFYDANVDLIADTSRVRGRTRGGLRSHPEPAWDRLLGSRVRGARS